MRIKIKNNKFNNYNMNNKEKYGEVITPLEIIDEIYENIKPYIMEKMLEKKKSKKLKILDIGTGDGKFIKKFIEKFPEISEESIFYGIDLNPYYETIFNDNLSTAKIKNAKINNMKIQYVNGDFLEENVLTDNVYDLIIGNPPFNNNGLIKVPCNKKIEKKKEGNTVWSKIIKKAINLLDNDGFITMITPCIWLKPDKSKTYDILVKENDLLLIKSYESYESHKIFRYNAQTPINYFLSYKNKGHDRSMNVKKLNILTNKSINKSTNKNYNFELKLDNPIPTHNIDEVKKSQTIMKENGIGDLSRLILKSNPINEERYETNEMPDENRIYKNIKTCMIDRKDKNTQIIYNYTNKPCPYYGEKKIYCAHKRLPIFLKDIEEKMGISRRDTYLITESRLIEEYPEIINKNNVEKYLNVLYEYLNHEETKKLIQCTKYRMNYLEKYAYSYVPNIVDYVIKNKYENEEYDKIISFMFN